MARGQRYRHKAIVAISRNMAKQLNSQSRSNCNFKIGISTFLHSAVLTDLTSYITTTTDDTPYAVKSGFLSLETRPGDGA
eukprot:2257720-Pleurochrysis_carterae.AAC.1